MHVVSVFERAYDSDVVTCLQRVSFHMYWENTDSFCIGIWRTMMILAPISVQDKQRDAKN